jgi:hypothetical protein
MSINSVVNDTVSGESVVNALKPKPPTITGYAVSGADDTALDPAGGQTVLLNGTGFQRGATITLNGSAIAVVTYVNANQLSFTSPAQSAGTYTIYAVNADGGTAIYIPGLIYSNLPTWTTGAGSLGSYYETQSITNTVVATGDAPVTYSLFSGALPTGAVFNANGTISGTAPADTGSTTYSFTVQATDAQLQDSTRSFSLTINTDVVTWTAPNANATYNSTVGTAIANVGLSAASVAGAAITYSANSLPTGISLSGNVISGTPTASGSSSTLLTATAATTRSATRVINWTIAVASDAYFKTTTLLLQGTDTFVKDSSSNNFGLTIAGDTKPNSFNPYTPGYYSNYFDGSGDRLDVSNNTALQLNGVNFTLEAWVYYTTATAYVHFFSKWNTSSFEYQIYIDTATGVITINTSPNGTGVSAVGANSASNAITANRWYHVAWVRNGSTDTLYINGISVITSTSLSAIYAGTSSLSFFGRQDGSYYGTGYLSNARVVKGTAVYTNNFTPSTTPLTAISGTSLLTCQSNRFIDNSTNNFTVTVTGDTSIKSFQPFTPNSSYSTYGSGYFDGTGDYLSIPTNTALNFGTGDFTVEGWFYFNSLSNSPVLWTKTDNTSSGWFFEIAPTSIYFGFATNLTSQYWNPAITLATGVWYHIATTRTGSSLAIYINGTQYTSTLSNANTSYDNTTDFRIGSYRPNNTTYDLNGYISNFRVVKSLVYTTSFTPPATPLTAIANTSLLTLQNNQPANNSVFLDSSSNNFFVTRNGNATQGSFSPYGGNWSNYFNGSSNLSYPVTAAFTGQTFTIESWVNFTQYSPAYGGSSYACVLVGSDNGTNGFELWIGGSATSFAAIGFLARNSGTVTVNVSQSYSFSLNTWYHVALVKSGNSYTFYVNGTSIGTSTSAGTWTDVSTLYVGYISVTGYNEWMYGYISNLRIVTGTQVYTSAFTPSTTPLTPVANTSLLTCQSNRFVDNSINNYTASLTGAPTAQRFSPFNPSSLTPTSYSGYFDGGTNRLTTAGSSAFNLTGTSITLECWVYMTTAPSVYNRLITIGPNNAQSSLYLGITTGRVLEVSVPYVSGGGVTSGANLISLNTWTHLAFSLSGSTGTLYINGTQVGQTTGWNITSTNSNYFYIGYDVAGTVDGKFTGYVSNARLVVGTAVYTTAFTPSTIPLTAISGTSILTLQSTTLVDNSVNNFAITAVGNTKPSIQNPFGYTSALTTGYTASTVGGSGYFDGNGDYISMPYNSALNFGTGDFTIEFWAYWNSVSAATSIYIPFSSPYGQIAIASLSASATTLRVFLGTTANSWDIVSGAAIGTISAGSWFHVAVTRSGSNFRTFLNGIPGATASSSSALYSATQTVTIGYDPSQSGSGGYPLNGYLSDFRIIRGTALYTSAFVPPAAPLTAIQNTVLLNNMTSAGVYDAAMMTTMETVGDAKISTAVSKFGGSSMSFDGTGDYLSSLGNPYLVLGTGDFTIEFWFNVNSTSNNGFLHLASTIFPASVSGLAIYVASNNISMYCAGAASPPGGVISTGVWYHVAMVRYSGVTKLYLNGSYSSGAGSVTDTTNYTGSALVVGGYYNSTLLTSGYIDDLRITRGVARYTANFTPPTEQFQIK